LKVGLKVKFEVGTLVNFNVDLTLDCEVIIAVGFEMEGPNVVFDVGFKLLGTDVGRNEGIDVFDAVGLMVNREDGMDVG
jgi:hypothetical protein